MLVRSAGDNPSLIHNDNVIGMLEVFDCVGGHYHSFSSQVPKDCLLNYEFAHVDIDSTQNIIQ